MDRAKILTNGELWQLERRIDEINAIVDATDEQDILENLERELEYIIQKIERSYIKAKIKESGLRLIK